MSQDAFTELNAQCWRCQMYVPRIELRYYNGQLYCPYCVQDIIAEEEALQKKPAREEKKPGREQARLKEEEKTIWGTCEQCGRQAQLYWVRGRGLCAACAGEESPPPKKFAFPIITRTTKTVQKIAEALKRVALRVLRKPIEKETPEEKERKQAAKEIEKKLREKQV